MVGTKTEEMATIALLGLSKCPIRLKKKMASCSIRELKKM